jgi:hypothetical protein
LLGGGQAAGAGAAEVACLCCWCCNADPRGLRVREASSTPISLRPAVVSMLALVGQRQTQQQNALAKPPISCETPIVQAATKKTYDLCMFDY